MVIIEAAKRHVVTLGISVGVFVLIGFAVLGSRAASPSTSVEAESATTITATKLNDASASAAQTLQFGTRSSLLQPDSRGFAPYAYVPWGDVTMSQVGSATGIKNFTAAFVLSNGSCTPAWDGSSSLGLSSSRSTIIKNDINAVRAAGGDVTVSFGGEGGTELALVCPDVTALTAAYKSVIDTYELTRIDFDIEGTSITNAVANDKRAQSITTLQQQYPNLKVFVTLSVSGSGLPTSGIVFLQSLQSHGVVLAGVNIMTMDYGVSSTQMGQLAISSAQSTFNQLKLIFGADDTTTWKTLNMTPMIGINDTQPETFSLAYAMEVRTFADQHAIGGLSMWSINRDKSCANNAATLSNTCSGVIQTPYQYSGILNMPAR